MATAEETERDGEAALLSAREAARMCGIGLRTWHTLTSAGKTPESLRLGRRVLWRRDELLAWIDAGCPPRHNWDWPLDGRRRATA
jgi:predicted DNA-binding transcriptional regulator AlpA